MVLSCSCPSLGLGLGLHAERGARAQVRGHVIRVRAPWVKANYFVNEDNYILPNLDTVVLGGTAQVGDTDLAPREADRRHIWEGVLRMVPSLKGAPVRPLVVNPKSLKPEGGGIWQGVYTNQTS